MDAQIVTTIVLGLVGFIFGAFWKKMDKIEEMLSRLVSNDVRKEEQIKNHDEDLSELYDLVSGLEQKIKKSVA